MEKQITRIFDNTNELKEKQIKGESHLQELSDTVDFIIKKFDKYEQERKERRNHKQLDRKCCKINTKSRWPLRSCGKTRAILKAQLPATTWNSRKERRKYWWAMYQSDKLTFRFRY